MNVITKCIPLWIKEPIAVFFSELKYGHPAISFWHSQCSFCDIYNCRKNLKKYVYRKRQAAVSKYLRKKYLPVIQSNQNRYSQGFSESNFPIWLFWWQGELNAPEIVKICIENTRKMAGSHPVYVLSKENYNSFITLPTELINKVKMGHISITHLSDVLRMHILAERGGLWLDATIYCKKPIMGEEFNSPVFTGKNPGKDYTNVSNWEWTTYAMFGWRENRLYSLVRDVFDAYLKDHQIFIDYFLMDHIIRLVYDECEEVRADLKKLKNNNPDTYFLNDFFDHEYSQDMENRYLESCFRR